MPPRVDFDQEIDSAHRRFKHPFGLINSVDIVWQACSRVATGKADKKDMELVEDFAAKQAFTSSAVGNTETLRWRQWRIQLTKKRKLRQTNNIIIKEKKKKKKEKKKKKKKKEEEEEEEKEEKGSKRVGGKR